MHRSWLAAALVFLPFWTLGSQVQVTADVGSSILRQTGLPESAVFTGGADVRWTGPRGSLSSTALAALASDGRGTGQALIVGALQASPQNRARWEIAGSASAYGLTNDLPTTSLQFMAREYVGGALRGVFVGAGGAGIVRNQLWRAAVVGQTGGWWRRGFDQFLGTLSATTAEAESHQNFPGFGDFMFTERVVYADLSTGWRRDDRAYSIIAAGGLRAGFRGVSAFDGWASVTGEWWMTPRAALVGGVGRGLADVIRGVPPTRYATLALRVALQPRATLVLRPAAAPVAGPRLIVSSSSGSGERTIEVVALGATSVEIMADFTSWEPVALARRDGESEVWRVERPIEPGPHRIAIRINGGEWSVPANLPRVSNGFGGTVGLITVP
jgi:hypothetical protein